MKRADEDRRLGLDLDITRRDFLNATLRGTGAVLALDPAAALAQWPGIGDEEAWYGPGGVGEYASSHGNTPEVLRVAHELRDRRYERLPADLVETGETYDLVVVGGGFAGLSAAHEFLKGRRADQSCLLLENHPMFGGEAKPNEFEVAGQRVFGPQGSNAFAVPSASFGEGAALDPHRRASIEALRRVFEELRVPTEFEFQRWDEARLGPLRFAADNFEFMLVNESEVSVGHRYGTGDGPFRWVRDPWTNGLADAPLPEAVKRDLLRWRTSSVRPYEKEDFGPWLDGMTYKQFLEGPLGLSPEVTAYADPILAAAMGLGSDAISAYGTLSIQMPGVKAYAGATARYPRLLSFPGGNDGFVRYYVKTLVPEALPGGHGLGEVLLRPVTTSLLDRPGAPVRIRLSATAVHVEHEGSPGTAERVSVVYVKGGRSFRVRARAVVMATGSWITRHVVRDLTAAHASALAQFQHSALLVANVALTNWRFLHKLGITACRYAGDFGFSCNIRQPMIVGDYRPPLDPEAPTVLTFYVPFFYPGRPAREQGTRGRLELVTTSFADYERQIRRQMTRLFESAGFDARRDIAGIVLNRWGHAYVNPQPGFYFGKDGAPAPREILRQRHGRIAFGHSELEGHQNWPGAVRNGARAARQVL